MLVDVPLPSDARVRRLYKGVYECGDANFHVYLDPEKVDEYPFGGDSFGVCDNFLQVREKHSTLFYRKNKKRKFVVSLALVLKAAEPPQDGWRWCKWGEYIGTQSPQCEYIYDEPEIKVVYCYHIYELK